jgi:hypothetical protein
MTTIILVESNGTVKQSKVKDLTFDNLYKKCGFRVAEHFGKRATWNVPINEEMISVELWSKNEGKANTENKYDFPPPVDKELYFGTCVLIRIDENEEIVDLTTDLWNKIYEKLFGGFDDIDEDEEPSEDELEKVPKSMKTKHGYLKDGFVVDNAIEGGDEDDDDDEDYDEDNDVDDDTDNEYEEENIVERVRKNHKHDDNDEEDKDELEGSELEEEPYEYSDEE